MIVVFGVSFGVSFVGVRASSSAVKRVSGRVVHFNSQLELELERELEPNRPSVPMVLRKCMYG
jgi:hypothetical protein